MGKVKCKFTEYRKLFNEIENAIMYYSLSTPGSLNLQTKQKNE